jgi:peptidoglycan hydrolase CwlO-like protein
MRWAYPQAQYNPNLSPEYTYPVTSVPQSPENELLALQEYKKGIEDEKASIEQEISNLEAQINKLKTKLEQPQGKPDQQ